MSAVNIYNDDDAIVKIGKRRLNILIQQAQQFGSSHVPPHVLIEIKEIATNLTNDYNTIINQKGRRLHGLQMKKATQGLNADPAVDIEIKDLNIEIEVFNEKVGELARYVQ